MSDGTAAREPSMEDILASIRRIIDEEDTRDARPSSEGSSDSSDDGAVDAPLPVMAAASVDRAPAVDAAEEAEAASGAEASGGEGEAIFPERESLFWSRATGRGAPVPSPEDADPAEASADAGAEDGDENGGGSSGIALAAGLAGAGAVASGATGSATDIFTRAQNKLEATGSRLSARERMQNLAARSAERADEAATDAMEPLADLPELSELDDVADDALPDFSAVEEDDADILELTQTVDEAESDPVIDIPSTDEALGADDAPGSEGGLIARAGAGAAGMGAAGAGAVAFGFGDGSGSRAETGADAGADYEDAFEAVETTADDAGAPVVEEAKDDAANLYEDVFDLTTPIGPETEEVAEASGDDAPEAVAEADAEMDAEDDIEAAIAESLAVEPAGERLEEVAGEVVEDTHEAPEADETVHVEGTLDNGDAYSVEEPDETVTEESAAPEEVTEIAETAEDDAAHGSAIAAAAVAGLGATAAYGLSDREDEAPEADRYEPFGSGEDRVDADHERADEPVSFAAENGPQADESAAQDDLDDEPVESLAFSDTFSASDVYHDEPPALDDDYSASLDTPEEEPMRAAAFADDAAYDAPDDGMERVGGLVRDAMERDPVDYADPSALVSMTSEEISARALASLADVEGEASRRMYGAMRIGEDKASESIEGMVKSMLQPMLREWLDDNLPDMVETMVRGEVERISAKSRKYSRASRDD